MDQEAFFNLAGRVLAGEVTTAEREKFSSLLEKSEQHWYEFELLKRSWEQTKITSRVKKQEDVFRNILSAIDDRHELELGPDHTVDGREKEKMLPSFHGRYIQYAAVIAIFIISVFTVSRFVHTDREIQDDSITRITKTNPAGQKSQIHLPDGSTVWLNTESSITYPEAFDSTGREVWIEGEAYFEVHKDLLNPFTVHTGRVHTVVLGTSFNINAYHEEETIEVALTEGRVKVEIFSEDKTENVFLTPGEALSFNTSNQIYQKEEFDIVATIGWKDGIIHFKKADFSEVLKTLSRWYGVKFTVVNHDPQSEWNYTGKFEKEYLDNILRNISFAKGFEYTINQENVTVTFN